MQTVTDIKSWIGKEQVRTGIIDHRQAELMAVTLGCDVPEPGSALPSLWHWLWFNDALTASKLGRDGHPQKGGFIPPVALPRRMWAGGKVEFVSPVMIGTECTKRSVVKDINEKSGRSGALCIVTIEHQILCGSRLCIREEQNLVYREDPKPDAPKGAAPIPPENPAVTRTIIPDPVLMFRYSALTFNGHRVHYDADYAREVEGYKGLVFHAPLTATMLMQLAEEIADGRPVRNYSYRATSPLFCNDEIRFCGREEDGRLVVWAQTPQGGQAMIGEAGL
ncbi:MAG: MaoC family dehydratase N-terminal domain-containing protein [Pseudomonadota bacterium]